MYTTEYMILGKTEMKEIEHKRTNDVDLFEYKRVL